MWIRTTPRGEEVPEEEVELDRYGMPKIKAGQVIRLDSNKPGKSWTVYKNVPSLEEVMKEELHDEAHKGYMEEYGRYSCSEAQEGEKIRGPIKGGDWGSCHIGRFDAGYPANLAEIVIGKTIIRPLPRGATSENPEGLGSRALKKCWELCPHFSLKEGTWKEVWRLDYREFYANIMREYPLPYGEPTHIKDPDEISKQLQAGKSGFVRFYLKNGAKIKKQQIPFIPDYNNEEKRGCVDPFLDYCQKLRQAEETSREGKIVAVRHLAILRLYNLYRLFDPQKIIAIRGDEIYVQGELPTKLNRLNIDTSIASFTILPKEDKNYNKYYLIERSEIYEIYLNEPSLSGELDLGDFTITWTQLKVYISLEVDETKLEIKNLPKKAEIIKLVNAQEYINQKYPTKEKREQVKGLYIRDENLEGELDLSDFNNLEELDCSCNKLINLDCSNLIHLEGLYCNDNYLTKIIYPTNPEKLTYLEISDNNFPEQNLTCFRHLIHLQRLELRILNTDIDSGLEYLPDCLESLACYSSTHSIPQRKATKIYEELLFYGWRLKT
ncbi:29281_t:CDS:10 [Racocetra persica]|uniref:29281_t:CDS:1 n=1 Tax=Racocetra persica TaxID=160502 RepID=A0ACA9LZ66_9GLOM|nr:29281_t:CDS:10 [Racocetra persica]